jgi:hypothetical protein
MSSGLSRLLIYDNVTAETGFLNRECGRKPQVNLRSRARHWSGCTPVLPGPDNTSRQHSPKTKAILGLFTATYQHFFCCMIQYIKAQQQKNIMLGRGLRNYLVFRIRFRIQLLIRILPFFTPNLEICLKKALKSEQIHPDITHNT